MGATLVMAHNCFYDGSFLKCSESSISESHEKKQMQQQLPAFMELGSTQQIFIYCESIYIWKDSAASQSQ